MLAPYACHPEGTRGRLYPEAESAFRSPYQRDRDRIIHAGAFRRLKHKTQVFVEHEGDSYRTRLTHSLEVAQVARTIARTLQLDQDLTEAVALAHDLGHTPFGHTGEDALAELMTPYGGFDHNAQAIRIVTALERHYADFDGMNLTWEALEGIAKHNGPVPDPVPFALAEYNARHDLELTTHASAEAQVAALAEDIAYNAHDLLDGLRAGLFQLSDIEGLPALDRCFAEVDGQWPNLDQGRRKHEALRRFFGLMVEDVLTVTQANLADLAPTSAADIRAAGRPVVAFSRAFRDDLAVVRQFLFTQMYRAPAVIEMRRQVTQVVRDLFPLYMQDPTLMPQKWQADIAAVQGEQGLARIVADYIAGMTDRFALREHARLIESRAA